MNCHLEFLRLRFSFRFVFLVVLLCCTVNLLRHQISQAQSTTIGNWTSAGNIITPRYGASATLLPSGKVLIAGGYTTSPSVSNPIPTNSSEIYDPATGQSTPTGNLNDLRGHHTATLLPNGKVLIVSEERAELYDPITGIWTRTTNPSLSHFTSVTSSRITATLLPNGKVLVIGGCNCSVTNTSAELFDPASETWKATGSMIAKLRFDHTATLLSDGKVLIAGGSNTSNRAEIYDPATDSWSAANNMNVGKSGHVSARLPNGKVLVVGGKSAEIYDPGTGVWTVSGDLNFPRSGAAFSLLSDGKALICGGRNNSPDSTSELLDPNAGTWFFIGDLTRPRISHTVVTLADGRVLAVGGRSDKGALKSVEAFHPSQPFPRGYWTFGMSGTNRFGHATTLLSDGNVMLSGGRNQSAGILNSAYTLVLNYSVQYWDNTYFMDARQNHTGTLLPNGDVLIAGGEAAGLSSLSSCELYTPSNFTKWRRVSSLVTPRRFHTATLLNNGKVLVVGGANEDVDLSSAELYDPEIRLWGSGGFLGTGRRQHTATLLLDGKVLVVGGLRNGVSLASAEIYDPASGTWSTTSSLKFARSGHTATLLNNGKVLIAGGVGTMLVAGCELYDPATGQWSDAGQLSQPRQNHASVLLGNGRAIITAGSDSEGVLNSVEVFDPTANGGAGAWGRAASLKTARELHTLILMPNGRVLAFCGRNASGAVLDSVEVFDPTATPVIPIVPSNITPVSATTFQGGTLARESIVAIFGERLAAGVESPPSFAGTRIDVRDSTGQTRAAALFYVSPTQINCQIPPGTAIGASSMTLTTSTGSTVSTNINIASIVPGVFSADASGTGLAAAVIFRVKANGEQVYEPVVRFDTALNRLVAVPVDVSDSREQVFLILNGTGWRFRSRLSAVGVTIGGTASEVIFAGAQGTFIGLDQVNVRLPSALAGRGEVDVRLTVDGIEANAVTVVIK